VVVFADYTEPSREFNALWKSYDDLSRAVTASPLPKPIAVNCFTASTSSLSPELFSRGGARCEPRAGIGGGFCASCDFFFFPNGSRILSLEVLAGCSFSFSLSTAVGRGWWCQPARRLVMVTLNAPVTAKRRGNASQLGRRRCRGSRELE